MESARVIKLVGGGADALRQAIGELLRAGD